MPPSSVVVLVVELVHDEQLPELLQGHAGSQRQGAGCNALWPLGRRQGNGKGRAEGEGLQLLYVFIRLFAVPAMLGVAVPDVKDLLVGGQPRRQRGIAGPGHAASCARAQPTAELDAALVHLVRGVGDLSELRLVVGPREEALVAEVLLLVMQQHGVLVQEERREHMLQPDRHGAREELHGLLVHDPALASDGVRVEDQEADVPALAGHCRRVVDREDHAAVLLVLHEAWRPEVKDAWDTSHSHAPVRVHLPVRLHVEPLWVCVAVARDIVVGHQEVGRIHGVLEEYVPAQLQIPKVHWELDPLVLELRIMQLLDQLRVLELGLLVALGRPVRPHKEQPVLFPRGEGSNLGAATAFVFLLQVFR
mmetsp:Transcript_150532/g.419458  ORF Transcript_150532/g.419458 Transcript_150532/m.419458 type:complete len:364 (-) Transcript_150532:816-1907(-)